jgi:hypothetical protein
VNIYNVCKRRLDEQSRQSFEGGGSASHMSTVEIKSRVLASVQKITGLSAIPKADKIEVARVLGCDVIVPKGVYKVDELVVFLSPDSLPPPEAATTWAAPLKGKPVTVRQMFDVNSEGFVVKFCDCFPDASTSDSKEASVSEARAIYVVGDRYASENSNGDGDALRCKEPLLINQTNGEVVKPDVLIGQDVTERLGVVKWIPSVEYDSHLLGGGTQIGWGIPQTNEDRFTESPASMAKLQRPEQDVVITDKLDGTSFTVAVCKGEIKIASRSTILHHEKGVRYNETEVVAKECSCGGCMVARPRCKGDAKSAYLPLKRDWKQNASNKHYFEITRRHDLDNKLLQYCSDTGVVGGLAVQAELCGPKINGNNMKLKRIELYVFNVYDIATGRYVRWSRVEEIAAALGVMTVPAFYRGKFPADWNLGTLKKMADDHRYFFPDLQQIDHSLKVKSASLIKDDEDVKGILGEGIVIRSDHPNTDSFNRVSYKILSLPYEIKHGRVKSKGKPAIKKTEKSKIDKSSPFSGTELKFVGDPIQLPPVSAPSEDKEQMHFPHYGKNWFNEIETMERHLS